MEIFLELVFTIALSLLFSFFLAKILSASPSCSTYSDHVVSGERKFEAKSNKLVAEVMEVGDLGESRQDKFVPEEMLNDSCGSCDDLKIDENKVLREVEVVGISEKLGEESADNKSDGVRVCEENLAVESIDCDKIGNFEMDLTKDEILESENMNEEENDSKKKKEEENVSKGYVSECEEIFVDKTGESEKIAKIETELNKDEIVVSKSEEIEILKSNFDNEIREANQSGEDGVKKVLFDEDDDWEGIERTELESLFGVAAAFVGNKSNADAISSLGNDVKTQLYGLHKIATEGPCREPQPMALKVSARANWNAWKQLGNMAPEVAMEQYVTILLRSIPGFIQDDINGDNKQSFADADACSKLAADLKAWKRNQLGAVDERNIDELMPCVEDLNLNGSLIQTP